MKRRKGEFIGGYAIYGYCKDERNKNRLVVDEYAADIVRSIYRRKLEGMSAQAIAEQLNSENVLAPSEYKRLCGLNYHSGFKAKAKAEMNRQRDCLNNLDVEHLPWIEDFKSYQNLTSLNRRVLVELVENITVYDKEHIHIQYRFEQEIRNVLEYCSSVPQAETEGNAV